MGSYDMNANTADKSLETVIVHKDGDEGTLQINARTGKIVTPNDQQPAWAEGLTVALVQERVTFYEKRLGAESTAFKTLMGQTEAIEFSDLGWLGVDAQQQELEITADPSYRSEVIAKALGIDTESGDMTGKALAEREVSRENRGRTQSEIEALEDSVRAGFQGGERAAAATGSAGAARR